MSMSKELFLAILSMDAYNRGYGAGLADEGSNDLDGLGEVGQLGNATLLTRASFGVDDQMYQSWQAARFYATAYDWNGETVISYQGTDVWTELPYGMPTIRATCPERLTLLNQAQRGGFRSHRFR